MGRLNEFELDINAFFSCCHEASFIPLRARAGFPATLAEVAEFGLTDAS
jgi:hypothetical protein